MGEGSIRPFERNVPAVPTRDQVIDALADINTVDKSKKAAKLLGQLLQTIDTSHMKSFDQIQIAGLITHCQKVDAEITDPERYITLLQRILPDEKK